MASESTTDGNATPPKPFPQVAVYTSSDCRWCPRLKEYLSQNGVAYTEKNVELDEAAAAEALSFAGRRQTPVTVIGSHVVVGFQRGELDALLGLNAYGLPGHDALA